MVVSERQQELPKYLCTGERSWEDEKQRAVVQKPASTARQQVLMSIWSIVRRIVPDNATRRSSLPLQSCTPLSRLNEEKQRATESEWFSVKILASEWVNKKAEGTEQWITVRVPEKRCNDSELRENKRLTRSNEETRPGEQRIAIWCSVVFLHRQFVAWGWNWGMTVWLEWQRPQQSQQSRSPAISEDA